MVHFVGPDKHRSELIQVPFDFVNQIPTGTVITASQCVCTVTVLSGTDASPQTILVGSPTVTGTAKVRQAITLGVLGLVYQVTMKVTLSVTSIVERDCYVAIVPEDPQVTPPAPSPPANAIAIHGVPPNGTVGTAYSFNWTATGGTGIGYVFVVDSGLVPAGTALNVTTTWTNDTDAGTPTTAATYPFVLRVTDSGSNTTTAAESITIVQPLVGYVSNTGGGTESVIDSTYAVIATVTSMSNAGPIAVLPNRSFAYVCTAAGNVKQIDPATYTVVQTISTGLSTPQGIAAKHDNTTIYASATADNVIKVIDVATHAVTATWSGFSSPTGILMHPILEKMYVLDTLNNRIQCINTANTVLGTISISNPQGLGISADGNKLYVGRFGGITVYDTTNYALLWALTYSGGFGPNNVAITLDGKKAYVSNYNVNSVAVISTLSQSVLGSIDVGSLSYDVKTHPVSGLIYVPAILVRVINPVTDTIIQSITVGATPNWIAFPPS